MRAVAIEAFGGAQQLKLTGLPRPRTEKGEVLVRTVAAGVNPIDARIRQGELRDQIEHRFPLVPGYDVAGVVEELGEGVSGYRKGDRVWGVARKALHQWGSYAEFVGVPENQLSLMPAKLLYEEAAGVPYAALTAFQAFFSKKPIEKDSFVLIHRAAGGVGHFAVQLASAAGAKVLGTARAANHSFVLGLGAQAAIDYSVEPFGPAVSRYAPEGVDFILDAVGGETLEQSWEVLKPGGTLVSIVSEPEAAKARSREATAHYLHVEPNTEQLMRIAREFDQKRLRVEVEKIYAIGEALHAHQRIEEERVVGKLVLNL